MPSSFKIPGEFHDSCRPFYELLTSPPFELRLAARIHPKQGKRSSRKTRLPGAPLAPSRGVYAFVGFFGSIAKVGLGNAARFRENYAWEYKGSPIRRRREWHTLLPRKMVVGFLRNWQLTLRRKNAKSWNY